MKIETLAIRRFKSLYDVNIPLSGFSVLTGPNGSGKSNMMAAIDFIGETYRYGLEYAVGRAGGIGSIAYRRTKRTTAAVAITVEATLSREDINERSYPRPLRTNFLHRADECKILHSFSIRPSRNVEDSIFSVAEEVIEMHVGPVGGQALLLKVKTSTKAGNRSTDVEFGDFPGYEELRDLMGSRLTREFDFGKDVESLVESTELLITAGIGLPIAREFRNQMARLQVYRLNPAACRKPGILLPNASIGGDGENLPGTLARMRRTTGARAADRWLDLVDSMAEIFPNLEDIKTGVTSLGELEIQIWEQNVGRAWSAAEISDGTIQYLALLAVLLDHRSPALAIEEPENALHSWMLRRFLEKCRHVPHAQVLLTTHSPVVLRSVTPDEVLLAWKSSGKTQIAPLVEVDPESRYSYSEGGVDVYEQYDSGFLPQTIPSAGSL